MSAPISALPIAAALAVAAGVMVTIQPAFNGQLAQKLSSTVQAAFISFSAGTLTLLVAMLILRPALPSRQTLAEIPPHLFVSGGMLGAFFVAAAAWSAPKVGVGVYLAILVAAQLIAALALDHFGIAGLTERAITWTRVIGVVLLISGAILVTRG